MANEMEKIRSSTPLTTSSRKYGSEKCDPENAAILAGRLFRCYRVSDANDPETFVTAVAATLSRYPEWVAVKVCDPLEGLPAQSKWLPAIAEVRDACEKLLDPERELERSFARMAEREARIQRQLEERDRRPSPESVARVRALADQLKAEIDERNNEAQEPDARKAKTEADRVAAVAYHERKLAEIAARNRSAPVRLSQMALERLEQSIWTLPEVAPEPEREVGDRLQRYFNEADSESDAWEHLGSKSPFGEGRR